ncbi:hypothetical protein ACUN16_27090 [Bacillus cereus group sp. Bce003]
MDKLDKVTSFRYNCLASCQQIDGRPLQLDYGRFGWWSYLQCG